MDKKIEELLNRGVENIYPSKEALLSQLESGKKLKLYQGFDPTGVQLHIGHMVGLMKLRQWQELGHEVIFLIGDGTGQAGDPSGKTRGRDKYLNNSELRENAKDYVMQASRVVKFDGDNAAKILYNGDWLNKLTLVDVLDIADNFTLQQLEERDLYANRKKAGESINMREFFYPLLQAYDSVAMGVDLELGGDDQTFNMLCGRNLVKKMLNKEKFVMTTPLLSDSNGKKIGKTEGNAIALDSEPSDFYGMIMSLSDDVIVKSFEYITDIGMGEVREIESKIANGENPMIFKKRLAYELTRMLNDEAKAHAAQEHFESVFSKREAPETMSDYKLKKEMTIVDLLADANLAESKSQARRLVEQGAVKIDGETVGATDLILEPGEPRILKVGKLNYLKIV
jgi:tyrosyl-tRNA synthetase